MTSRASPQVKSRHQQAFLAWLRALGVGARRVVVPASSLREVHGDLDPGKVGKFVETALHAPGEFAPLLASSDGVVFEGRHRLAAARGLGGPDAPVDAWVIGLRIGDLLRVAPAFPLSGVRGGDGPPKGRRIAVLRHAGGPFTAEVVASREDAAKGLSGRFSLPPDHGMLFAFPEPGLHSFWMRGTPLPLSVAFLRDDGTVAGTADMAPFTEDRHQAPEPVRLALEMPMGWFGARGIAPGSRIAVVDSGRSGP